VCQLIYGCLGLVTAQNWLRTVLSYLRLWLTNLADLSDLLTLFLTSSVCRVGISATWGSELWGITKTLDLGRVHVLRFSFFQMQDALYLPGCLHAAHVSHD
jgi:hypothetical protein